MNTEVYMFNGPYGERVPIVAPVDIFFPTLDIMHYVPEIFGSHCGAGKGWGDKVVPETMWGLVVTLACYIHDEMWDKAAADWGDFHQSNAIFIRNLISIVRMLSRVGLLKRLRMYRTVTYFNFVDAMGPSVFWGLKQRQGLLDDITGHPV